MFPGLSLRANFLWTAAGNVAYAVCQWGVLVILAKLGSPEIVGRFGLGLALTGPVIVLSQLQLRSVLATDSTKLFAFRDYLDLRLILTAAALAVIVVWIGLGGYSAQTSAVICAIALGKAAESIADVYYAWFQQHERMDRIAWAQIVQGGLTLTAVALTMALSGSLVWAAWTWAAAAAASLALCTLPCAQRLAHEVNRESQDRERADRSALSPSQLRDRSESRGRMRRLGQLTWLALPLGVVMMLISLQTNVPRYFLEAYRGDAELGIYTALAYLTVAGNVVMQALGQAASPRMARYHARGERGAFRRLLLRLLAVGFLGGVGGLLLVVLAGTPLLRLLYTPEYAEHVGLLALLMMAAAIGYIASYLGYALTAARIFRAQVPLFALVTLATTAACWLWVPAHGMRGAAGALIAAAVVQLIGSGLVLALAARTFGGQPST